MNRITTALSILGLAFTTAWVSGASAAPGKAEAGKQRVIDHWTAARRAAATPRDFFVDRQGRAYRRQHDGSLIAYGGSHGMVLRAENPTPVARPGGGGGGSSDSNGPVISGMQPANASTFSTDSVTFSAQVVDAESGVRSVSFVVVYPGGTSTQSFSPSHVGNDTWQVTINGFYDGSWGWYVLAKDGAKRGGNSTTSDTLSFDIDTGGGGGGGGDYIVSNAGWTAGGTVMTAAGRIYFEMPSNPRLRRWNGYVCSGTVVTDLTTGRSVILTAAHCVYDDANKAFARNVLFIPDQMDTSGSGTDLNCGNDPLGCWAPSFGVVDTNWTTLTFPDNIEWDYAFYVVSDTGAHSGTAAGTDVLDAATGALTISFDAPYHDDGNPAADSIDFTHALGYSYSDDPNFMYCAEDMTTEGDVNWWLPSCGLSGGASGGPWLQPADSGNGPIISVNSWGYTTGPGMAGPKLSGSSAACVFDMAKGELFESVSTTDGSAGISVDCP